MASLANLLKGKLSGVDLELALELIEIPPSRVREFIDAKAEEAMAHEDQ